MRKDNFLIDKWNHLSITAKYTSAFAILVFIMTLIGLAGYASVSLVKNQTETAILSSAKIQHTILAMKAKIEEARRLENYFFLKYPTMGLEKAVNEYGTVAENKIEEVIRLSSELKQMMADLDVSESIKKNQVNLNYFLSSSQRHLKIFKETIVLVDRLVNEKSGLKQQLERTSLAYLNAITGHSRPELIDLYHQMQVFETKYWLERKRYHMQSAFNIISLMTQRIGQSTDIYQSAKTAMKGRLNAYTNIAEEILNTDSAINAKLNEFELQVSSLDPISKELIRLSQNEVQKARDKIQRTSFLATLFFVLSAILSIGLVFIIAMVLHKTITLNIISLNEAAREYKKGNLSARPEVNTYDETGVLADSFVSMAERITGLIEGLEQKVKEQEQTNLDLTNEIRQRQQAQEERQKLESQLRQAQKMESLGTLSGGIAHDLNNLLSPILGYGELLQQKLKGIPEQQDWIDQIFSAGLRAKKLVQKLLAFGRKQTLEVREIDVNEVIRAFEKLIRRTIREDIEIQVVLSNLDHMVLADPGQMEQIIMNLAINAQDAMPEGGRLIIETSEVTFDPSYAKSKEIVPGRYVMIAVSDSGHGMEASIQERIFDPFYTTKEMGKGTGLGLATVYGIVKQHNGHIWVYSEIDKGTIFKVYLPAIKVEHKQIKEAPEVPVDLHGTEVILVVEDEQQVLEMVCEILDRQGYTVLSTRCASDCQELIDDFDGPIHLLLTDVVMPEMNGKELHQQVSKIYPDIRLLFMSGYTGNVISNKGIIDESVNFIQKPFSMNALSRKVRQVLDSNHASDQKRPSPAAHTNRV